MRLSDYITPVSNPRKHNSPDTAINPALVGLNVRVAFNDVTLPTGGGKSGKEPLAVQKGTTISKSLLSAISPSLIHPIDFNLREISLLFNGHATSQGYLRRGCRSLPPRALGGVEHQPLAFYPVQPVSIHPGSNRKSRSDPKLTYFSGPRICMGRNFGQQQMKYVLARICQEFEEVRVPDGQREQQIKIELNTKMAHPCMCQLVPKMKV